MCLIQWKNREDLTSVQDHHMLVWLVQVVQRAAWLLLTVPLLCSVPSQVGPAKQLNGSRIRNGNGYRWQAVNVLRAEGPHETQFLEVSYRQIKKLQFDNFRVDPRRLNKGITWIDNRSHKVVWWFGEKRRDWRDKEAIFKQNMNWQQSRTNTL